MARIFECVKRGPPLGCATELRASASPHPPIARRATTSLVAPPSPTRGFAPIAFSHRNQAREGHIDGVETRSDLKSLLAASRAISLFGGGKGEAEIAVLLAKKGIDPEFQRAAATLADQLAAASAAVPDDLRRVVLLTPAEHKLIADGVEVVSDIRKSLVDSARSLGDVSMAHAFVAGGSVAPTAGGTRAAIKLIVLNAPGHAALVADAGIGAEEMALLGTLDVDLEKIELTKEARISERGLVVGNETMAAMALERLISTYRARVRMACLRRRLAMVTALEILPRTAPERRAPAKKSDKTSDKGSGKANDKVSKGKAGETPAEGATGETPAEGAANAGGEEPPAVGETPAEPGK